MRGESDLERITVIKNGEPAKYFYGDGATADFHWNDPAGLPAKGGYYYLLVRQMNGEIAVTSPVRFLQ